MLADIENKGTRTLGERIGGRWSLAWQTFLLNAFLGLSVTFSTEEFSEGASSTTLKWLAVWLLSTLVVGTYLGCAGLTILRDRRITPIKPERVIFVNLLIGPLYTSASFYFSSQLGLNSRIDFLTSFIVNTMLVSWWSITISVFLDIATESKEERGRLMEYAIQIRIAELQESDIAARLRQEISLEISTQLMLSRVALEDGIKKLEESDQLVQKDNIQNWHSVAQLLESIAQDSIRPLSRSLLQKVKVDYPRVSWFAILKNIISEQYFLPGVIAVIDLIGAAPATFERFGGERATPAVVAVTLLILGIGYFFNFLMKKFPSIHSQLFIIGLFAFELIIVPLRVHYRERWIPGSASISWQIGQVALGVLVIFMASSFSAFRRVEEQTKAVFRQEINLESTAAIARALEIAKFAQEASRVLHGAIQSRLISCAMVIQKATETGNQREFTLALQKAYEVLDTPISEQTHFDSISVEVDRKVNLWAGLCEFEVSVELEEDEATSMLSQILGRIIEEGISNSIRHGKATTVQIRLSKNENEEIEVLLLDNGVGFNKIKPGIGTALIQQATNGNWSIKPANGGTLLQAFIKIAR